MAGRCGNGGLRMVGGFEKKIFILRIFFCINLTPWPSLVTVKLSKLVKGDSNLNRLETLRAVREGLEGPLWSVMIEVEKTLSGLSQTEHIDMEDPAAVGAIGAVIHSALPNATERAKLQDMGLICKQYKNGPSNKLVGNIEINGKLSNVNIELHYCGPQGKTSKVKHQFAERDIEREPELPGFSIDAPEDLLLFLGYNLGPSRTKIEKLFLIFADSVDRSQIELHRLNGTGELAPIAAPVSPVAPTGTKIKIRATGLGEKRDDASATDKRRDAASSS
jgi:hypothetical protein